jgi:RHH-type transcriptional regulator, proline utilization regulon repressor / proline dehydrogenase / delta 1-pyrroline-5-carboxylate dehydrogenase
MTSQYELGIGRAREILGRARAITDEAALAEQSVELARALLEASIAGAEPNERERAERLAALLGDPVGQAFVSALTDRAHRSTSGARLVEEVEGLVAGLGVPRSLAGWDRLQLRALQAFGSAVPELTARAVRRRIYEDAAPYLAPADPEKLAAFLRERTAQGLSVNVNHLGEEVLGEHDAARYLETYLELLARPEVDTISVKLSSIDPRVDVVAWEQTLARLGAKLARIYRVALEHPVAGASGRPEPKLVYLDMEAYRDLELTAELFMRVLDRPELEQLTAGIVLQAYIPDSHAFQARLLAWARARVERGGAPIRMRLVKGANLMMERIEASLRGFELATYPSKADVDASFRHMLREGTRPENARAVRLGIGSHNLFDIAYALLLREQRGVTAAVEPEMLEGMADPLRRVVQRVAGRVLVYAPSVDQRDFPTAVAYLVRRLDENTSEENFLRRSFGMHAGDASFEAERERFVAALAASEAVRTEPFRTQDRRRESPAGSAEGFLNEADSDFSQRANREWLSAELERARTAAPELLCSRVLGEELGGEERDGFDPSRPGFVPYRVRELDREGVVLAIERAHGAKASWANTPPERREELLLAVAAELRRSRGALIGAMVLDAGKRAVEADSEVSEAIDFAEYYARQHARLRARFELEPKGLVVVTPPWNFPLSIGLGSTLAALVAGNAVLLKPPPETPLVLARAVEVCLKAGVPSDALGLVLTNDEAAEPLVTDPLVAALVLTGGTETARLFRRLRPGLDLIAETGGKNALIVGAMSDREQAIQNAVRAAFGHAGQKCSALSVLILEREVYRSASFRKKLADAVASLVVGSAWDPETFVTPLIRPPSGALARALDTLDEGESWLVEPARSPENERLVGPGVRWDVAPGGFVHTTELFGPVLSVVESYDFDHALEIANATPYGLTAGLESLDAREHAAFVERMEAGNLYVNRPVTGAIVGRQPFGGHKASSFGPGYKAGGPNTLLGLAHVRRERSRPDPLVAPLSRGPRATPPVVKARVGRPPPDLGALGEIMDDRLRDADAAEQHELARRLRSYEAALFDELDRVHPQDEVLGHADSLVYRPCRVGVIVLRGVSELDLLCTLVAAHMVGAELELFAEAGASEAIEEILGEDVSWFESLSHIEAPVREERYERLRLVGPEARRAAQLLADTAPSLDADPVSDSGYIELRRYVIEQCRSIARHRYGNLSLHFALQARKSTPKRRP